MNKKILILTTLILLIIPISYATITVSHTCTDSRCTEGLPINYSVRIGNNINEPVTVNYIKIKDVATNLNYAVLDNTNIILQPGQEQYFNFTDRTPAPFDGSYTAHYIACFGITVNRTPEDLSVEICSQAVRSLTTLPLDKIECEENSQCTSNQYCDIAFFKCRDLTCENGSVINHQCISYSVPVLILIALGAIIYLITATSKKN